jgi:hypothetical protein
MKFTRTISTVLLLSILATNALAAPCNCPETKAKPVKRTSQLVRQTPNPLRASAAPVKVLHYDMSKRNRVSAWWYIAAAAAGVGIGYLVTRSNDEPNVTNITVVAGEDD